MAQISCKKCGQILDSMNGKAGFCPYCGEKIAASAESAATTVQNLIIRLHMFLEDGNFQNAAIYIERILDNDPHCAEAYLGKVMVGYQLRRKEDLVRANIPLAENPDFKRAMEFADTQFKKELQGYLDLIHINNMNKKLAYALQCMQTARTEQDFLKAAELFKPLSGFENADTLYATCIEKAKDTAYMQAEQYIQQNTSASLQKAIDLLKRLPSKQDTDEKIAFCEAKIAEFKQKKRKKIKWTSIISLVLVVALVSSYFLYFADLFKYNEALNCIEEGNHKQACELFKELGDFKDSKSHLEKFEWVVAKAIITQYDGTTDTTEWQYNKDGLVTKQITTYSDGDQSIYEYQYNKVGLETKEIYTFSDGNQYIYEHIYEHQYQYNKDGLVTKQITTSSDGDQYIREYQYNKDGLKTKELRSDSDGDQFITNYEYNKNGLVTKEITTSSDGDQAIYEYQYNKDGRVTKHIYTNFDGDQAINEYQYNKDGRVAKHIYTNFDGDQAIYEFEFTPVYKKFGKQEDK